MVHAEAPLADIDRTADRGVDTLTLPHGGSDSASRIILPEAKRSASAWLCIQIRRLVETQEVIG